MHFLKREPQTRQTGHHSPLSLPCLPADGRWSRDAARFCLLTNLFAANLLTDFAGNSYAVLFYFRFTSENIDTTETLSRHTLLHLRGRVTGEHLTVLLHLAPVDDLHLGTEPGDSLHGALRHGAVLALPG